jgi:hypothetical protein
MGRSGERMGIVLLGDRRHSIRIGQCLSGQAESPERDILEAAALELTCERGFTEGQNPQQMIIRACRSITMSPSHVAMGVPRRH